jgi:hypothetical protein
MGPKRTIILHEDVNTVLNSTVEMLSSSELDLYLLLMCLCVWGYIYTYTCIMFKMKATEICLCAMLSN